MLLPTEPFPQIILAIIFKNQAEALLNHCGLKGWYVVLSFFFFFIVLLPSLAYSPHGTFVPAGLVPSVSIAGSIYSFLGGEGSPDTAGSWA